MWWNKKRTKNGPLTYLKFWVNTANNIELRFISKDKNYQHLIQLLLFLADNNAYKTLLHSIKKEYPDEILQQILSSIDQVRQRRGLEEGGPLVSPISVFREL